jgi:Ca2+-binding RTX toxin-like protein
MIKAGTSGDDRLKSLSEIDTLIGGLGNDISFVDQAADRWWN